MPFNFKTTYYLDKLTDSRTINDINKPQICPRCSYAITPVKLAVCAMSDSYVTICYLCNACARPFFTEYQMYKKNDSLYASDILKSYPKEFQPTEFDDSIKTVSPGFIEIFNQAKVAETHDLDQISGVGYRKSLEFLVKDYAIYLNSEDEKSKEKIRNMSLVQCIESYIVHPRIGEITKRAAWLGNDETHYVKKYTDENIETLKSLIKLSVNWITMDLDSAALEKRIVHPSQLQKIQQD